MMKHELPDPDDQENPQGEKVPARYDPSLTPDQRRFALIHWMDRLHRLEYGDSSRPTLPPKDQRPMLVEQTLAPPLPTPAIAIPEKRIKMNVLEYLDSCRET